MKNKLPLKRRSPQIAFARQIIDLTWQYRISRTLIVAHHTGVFRALAQSPASTATLATDLDLDADLLERILIACCALDLVRRDGPNWALTPKSIATLDPASPFYQGDYIDHLAGVWDFWHDLEPILRKQQGASAFNPDAARSRDHRAFILAMHNLAIAGRAAELVAHTDLSARQSLLDVGGGPGTYTMAFCQRFPHLHATLFDLPETTAIAHDILTKYNYSSKISLHPGNWDTDEFPPNHDAIFMSNILHGPGSSTEMKLQKARRTLPPGGLLIIQDFVLNNDKTGPLLPALFNIMVGAYSLNEMLALLTAAGFTHLATRQLPTHSAQTLLTAIRQ
jgi:hypothetical protein